MDHPDVLSTPNGSTDDVRRLRLIIEATPNAMVMVDTEGRVVLVNSQTEALFGYSRAELLKLRVEQLLPERFRQRHHGYREGFFRDPDTRAMGGGRDLYGLRKDGTEIPIEIGLNPLETDQGLFVLASVIDITERKRAEDRLSSMVEAAPNAMIMVNSQGQLVLVNSQAERAFGYPREELLTMRVEALIPDRYAHQHQSFREAFFAQPDRREMGVGRELYGRRKDGTEIPIEIGLNPIQISDEHFVLASIIDISERLLVQAADRATSQDQLRRSILDSLPFSIIATDRDGTIVTANPAAEKLLGYRQEELVGSSIDVIGGGPEPGAGDGGTGADHMTGQEREWFYRRKNGSRVPVAGAITAMEGSSGGGGYLTVAYDITQRIAAEAEVRHMAHHDVLTGLPNRTSLLQHLVQVISRARADDEVVVVLLLDLDHFKRVNDSLGHHSGDALLVEMAQRLRGCVREDDLVARLGGDEFVVVLGPVPPGQGFASRVEELMDVVQRPIELQGHELVTTASMGGATYPHDGDDPATLLKHADTAMYQAKTLGRNDFQWFSPAMLDETNDKIALTAALRQACDLGELSVVYQPQIALDSGAVVGMEALARWASLTHGEVAPDRFIRVAEDSRLITEIGEWVLRRACADAVAIHSDLGYPVRLAVNVSPRQFRDPDWLDVVLRALDDSGFDPKLLDLEITEGILMDKPNEVIDVMHALREVGIGIVIDDFGTGFSSLAYLTRFPIDKIKIDRSFIRAITVDNADAAIVDTIIAMAHALDITVVAEGIETAAQECYLRERRCDQAQGFRYAPGVPPTSFAPAVREPRQGPTEEVI